MTEGHCAWVNSLGNKEDLDVYTGYRPDQMQLLVADLNRYDLLVAHNGIGYDVPALEKLYGVKVLPPIYDTQVVSRLRNPDRVGGHSLKNLGIALGVFKGVVSEEEEEADVWLTFTEDMYEYCRQDVVVTTALLRKQMEHTPLMWALEQPINFDDYKLRG